MSLNLLDYEFLTEWVTCKTLGTSDAEKVSELDELFEEAESLALVGSFEHKAFEILRGYAAHCIEYPHDVSRKFEINIFRTCEKWRNIFANGLEEGKKIEWSKTKKALSHGSDVYLMQLINLFIKQGIEERKIIQKEKKKQIAKNALLAPEEVLNLKPFCQEWLSMLSGRRVMGSLDGGADEIWKNYKEASNIAEYLPNNPKDFKLGFGKLPYEKLESYLALAQAMKWKTPDPRFLKFVSAVAGHDDVFLLCKEFKFSIFKTGLVNLFNKLDDEEANIAALSLLKGCSMQDILEENPSWTEEYVQATLDNALRIFRTEPNLDCLRFEESRFATLVKEGLLKEDSPPEEISWVRENKQSEMVNTALHDMMTPFLKWLAVYKAYKANPSLQQEPDSAFWRTYDNMYKKCRLPFESMVLKKYEEKNGATLYELTGRTPSDDPSRSRMQKVTDRGSIETANKKDFRFKSKASSKLIQEYQDLADEGETEPKNGDDLIFLLGTYKYETVSLYLAAAKNFDIELDEENEYSPLLELLSDVSGIEFLQDIRATFDLTNGKDKFSSLVEFVCINGTQKRVVEFYYVHQLTVSAIKRELEMSGTAVENYLNIFRIGVRDYLIELRLLK